MRCDAWCIIGPVGIAVACVALAAAPAEAGLGGAVASVDRDRASLRANVSALGGSGYTVHVLTTANGVAREYAGPDGKVFAVTWQGRARPDLRTLLGASFAEFQASRVRTAMRQPITVNTRTLVARSGGHSGAFVTTAILPDAVPAGFAMENLK